MEENLLAFRVFRFRTDPPFAGTDAAGAGAGPEAGACGSSWEGVSGGADAEGAVSKGFTIGVAFSARVSERELSFPLHSSSI
jgi:hypothetical protein